MLGWIVVKERHLVVILCKLSGKAGNSINILILFIKKNNYKNKLYGYCYIFIDIPIYIYSFYLIVYKSKKVYIQISISCLGLTETFGSG